MPITYRPGTLDDTRAVYEIFLQSVSDLGQRMGVQAITGGDNPTVMAELWQRRRPLFEYLTQTADQFWIAENNRAPVGYARSIRRDSVQQLTEFFVLPDQQSAGVGRELLARAMPPSDATQRVIIATLDTRAVARYMKTGIYPHFSVTYFSRTPQTQIMDSDLVFQPLTESDLNTLNHIDRDILSYTREVDHRWMLSQRQGFLVIRQGQPVGYGYVGFRSGPFALLDAADYPAVLVHAESEAAAQGLEEFGLDVPLHNRAAVGWLLAHGYEMDGFYELFMTDTPQGRYENYIFNSPPFFT